MNPIEIAEYAHTNDYKSDQFFKWWVNQTLQHQDPIVSRIKAMQYWKGRMKFGIQILGTVEEALKLDKDAGNNLWQRAIKKKE